MKTMKLSLTAQECQLQKVVQELADIIATMRVKSTSPSRAGNVIQTRVTYVENGKRILGYFSVRADIVGTYDVKPHQLLEDVCGLRARCSKTDTFDVLDALKKHVITTTLTGLCSTVDSQTRKVHKSGLHLKINRTKRHEKARVYLEQAFDYVLREGLTDDEVKDMLKLAFVRATMDS